MTVFKALFLRRIDEIVKIYYLLFCIISDVQGYPQRMRLKRRHKTLYMYSLCVYNYVQSSVFEGIANIYNISLSCIKFRQLLHVKEEDI
jgi:hypothetical protein